VAEGGPSKWGRKLIPRGGRGRPQGDGDLSKTNKEPVFQREEKKRLLILGKETRDSKKRADETHGRKRIGRKIKCSEMQFGWMKRGSQESRDGWEGKRRQKPTVPKEIKKGEKKTASIIK